MKGPEICSLENGASLEGLYLLSKKSLPVTKAGKPFGALTLSDRSGNIDAKLWDNAEELLSGIEPGAVVRVSARVDSYQGRLQLVLNSIAAEPGADSSEFLQASPVPPEELQAGLLQARTRVKDKHLKKLLKKVFQDDEEFAEAFLRAPAAKGAHHAYVGGLVEHTVSVAESAWLMAGRYRELSADLLLTGALLHDIGKVDELTLGPPLGYTDAGRLEGHILLGLRRLEKALAAFKTFPPELAEHLRHLVASHHGEYAFGSPKRPKTAEALALHFLDDFDAKMAMYRDILALGSADGSNFSPFNRLLERFLYVGPHPLGSDEAASPEEAALCSPGLFD